MYSKQVRQDVIHLNMKVLLLLEISSIEDMLRWHLFLIAEFLREFLSYKYVFKLTLNCLISFFIIVNNKKVMINENSKIRSIALEIIRSFPKSHNWKNYITIKSVKRRLFFNVFIKKYWLEWARVKYNERDISRRMRIVEFLEHITNTYTPKEQKTYRLHKTFIIKTRFHKLVIVEFWKKHNKRLELLSLYSHL